MKKLFLHLRQLNSKSSQILCELNKEQPSLDHLKEWMDARQRSVDELGSLTENLSDDKFTKEEAEALDSLFTTFRNLNLEIVDGLNEVMTYRRREIINTVKKQKAIKSYQVSDQPDISYFQRK